ncbi:hypothetical protein [Roseateles sp.]|uniref:hypothetical protein n=1 Tax=Roseateles sp. TaxID=1971397 RepID=UPI002F40B5F1
MLVGALQKTPESLLHRALAGDEWSLNDHLLALVHDQLALANWQRSGKQRGPKPKPISPLARKGSRTGGGHGRSNDEVKALLARYRNGQVPG